MGYFWGRGMVQKNVLGSPHVVEQLLFSLVPSILTFEFELILVSFLNFWGPNGLFLGSIWSSETVLGSTRVVKQLSFSNIP